MSDSCQILQPTQVHTSVFSYSYQKQHTDYRTLNSYNPQNSHKKIQQLYLLLYFDISFSCYCGPYTTHYAAAPPNYNKCLFCGSCLHLSLLFAHISIVLERKVLSLAVICSVFQMPFHLWQYYFSLSKRKEEPETREGKSVPRFNEFFSGFRGDTRSITF